MPTNVREKIWLVFLSLASIRVFGAREGEGTSVFADLPLAELLTQKKLLALENSRSSAEMLEALPSAVLPPEKEARFKGLHAVPGRKTFNEEDHEDDKSWMLKKKEKHKINDILNISVTALSYLAFGGYLLCIIVGALREKRRRFLPVTYASSTNSQLTTILQQYLAQRPVRIKFPAVTLNHGGKKRRRRSGGSRPRSGFAGDQRNLAIADTIRHVELPTE